MSVDSLRGWQIVRSATRLCIVGHDVPGLHREGCPIEGCAGCMPAVAVSDLQVCGWHRARLVWAISAAPDLVGHILEHVDVGSSGLDIAGSHGSKAPPAPINLTAVDDANTVHATLASWALLVLEERPGDFEGPDWAGSDIRPAYKRRVAGGGMFYAPARIVGVESSAATMAVARWLLNQLDWCLTQPWADEMAEEIPTLIGRRRAAWPTEEHDAHLPIPCPQCGIRGLVRHAPRWAHAPVTIACTECPAIYDEDRYEWLIRLARAGMPRSA